MIRCALALVSVAALAACSAPPPQAAGPDEIPETFKTVAVMELTEGLEHAVAGRGEFRVADAWLGRSGLKCGVVEFGDGGPPTARFLEHKYGRPEKKFVTEGRPSWNGAEWSAECSDRTADLL